MAVEGRLQTRSYQAQDGSTRWVTEVVADNVRFLDWPKDGRPEATGAGDVMDDMQEDEVPF